MANEISKINDFIIAHYSANKLVNTITIVPTLTIDLNKENIYPLVNVDMTNTEIDDQVITVYFTMTIITERDKRPVKTDSKLLSDDNYIDNINETNSIAQRFINVLLMQNNDDLIEIDTMSNLTILKEWRAGNCDGVQFTIQLTIPNRGESC
jgi:hypothetical protein